MAVVSTMILRSLRLSGEKGRSDTLTSTEAVQCLAELNTMLESWQTERLMCYTVTQNSLALTTSTSTYTVGTNGVFAIARPTRLVAPCFIRDAYNADTPLNIIDAATYGSIVSKGAGFTVPNSIYYDAGYSATSTATIFLYPSPSAGLTLFINSWNQLQSFADASSIALFPPGYQLAIESNYAVHSAIGIRDISPSLMRLATQSKAAIKSLNITDMPMTLDALPLYSGNMNIFTGP